MFMSILLKIFIAVSIIILATELSKKNTTLAAILLAMPIVLFVSFTLIWEESKDSQKIALLTHETLMFILPVIPFLFLLSYLLRTGVSYYISLGISTIGITFATLIVQKYFLHS
jgi:hypothetical protein